MDIVYRNLTMEAVAENRFYSLSLSFLLGWPYNYIVDCQMVKVVRKEKDNCFMPHLRQVCFIELSRFCCTSR